MRSEADGECSTSRLGCDTLPTTNVTVKQFIQDIVTRRCYSIEKIGQCTEAALQEIAHLQVTKFERTDMKTNDVYVGESVVTFTLIMPKPVVRGRDQSVDIAALVVDSLANSGEASTSSSVITTAPGDNTKSSGTSSSIGAIAGGAGGGALVLIIIIFIVMKKKKETKVQAVAPAARQQQFEYTDIQTAQSGIAVSSM